MTDEPTLTVGSYPENQGTTYVHVDWEKEARATERTRTIDEVLELLVDRNQNTNSTTLNAVNSSVNMANAELRAKLEAMKEGK